MNPDFDAALSNAPWSLSGVIFGLGSLRDDEGRPMGERRAPAIVKEGVPMELRPCPYRDERQRRSINVSALEQILRHLDFLLDDVAGFRAMMGSATTTWEDVYVAVMDQLTRPAVHLLRCRQAGGSIPARMSVGYKVAAGFSIPLLELLELETQGRGPTVSVETLLDLVRERKLLVGAGEVCAAPPALIARVTETLINGVPGVKADLDPQRLATARTLTLQVRVGIAWRLFDLTSERGLLVDEIGRKRLGPRTKHLARMLDERAEQIEVASTVREEIQLPLALSAEAGAELRSSMRWDEGDEARRATERRIEELLDHRVGAIEIDAAAGGLFARRFATYLTAYRTFIRVLRDLELQHRRLLGYPEDVPVKLSGAIFPIPKALSWFERILGHRLRPSESNGDALEMRNLERAVPV